MHASLKGIKIKKENALIYHETKCSDEQALRGAKRR